MIFSKKYRTIIRKYHLVEHENEFNEENILNTFEFYEDNGIIYNHIDEKNDASIEYQEEETLQQEGINIKLNSNNGIETNILYNNSYDIECYDNNDVTIIDVSNYENKDTFDYFKCRDEQLKIISNYMIKDIALIISDYSVEEEKTKKEQYNRYEYTENEKLYKKAKYFGCKRSLKNNEKCFLETNIIVNNKLKLYLYKRKESDSDNKHSLIFIIGKYIFLFEDADECYVSGSNELYILMSIKYVYDFITCNYKFENEIFA